MSYNNILFNTNSKKVDRIYKLIGFLFAIFLLTRYSINPFFFSFSAILVLFFVLLFPSTYVFITKDFLNIHKVNFFFPITYKKVKIPLSDIDNIEYKSGSIIMRFLSFVAPEFFLQENNYNRINIDFINGDSKRFLLNGVSTNKKKQTVIEVKRIIGNKK